MNEAQAKERIIVSLTTWEPRIQNIPNVLDSIWSQTKTPDLVVLNVSHNLIIPDIILKYLENHGVEIQRVRDTKVYKKIIPTLLEYPQDCIISIDDDFIYPNGMIEDFVTIHQEYPNHPISGNRVVMNGVQCHCGCASLVQKKHFGDMFELLDDELMSRCPSSDVLYTYFANRTGYFYLRTKNEYCLNMIPYNEKSAYSADNGVDLTKTTWDFLYIRYGRLNVGVFSYFSDAYLNELTKKIEGECLNSSYQDGVRFTKTSFSYRLGHIILLPAIWIKKIILKCI